jgi:TolB-like protein/Tfp pilus assembly protein PilF
MSFFDELKRRNVFRVGVAYAVTAWLILQFTEILMEILELPGWVGKTILVLLAVGFILALVLAWAFELTPEGVKKESEVDRSQSVTANTGRKLDYAIMALLAVGLVYFIWESRFRIEAKEPAIAAPVVEEIAPTAGLPVESATVQPNSIAVLPFINMSGDADNEFFSDGVSEEILNVLARIPELKVAARTSAFAFKGTNSNISEIARELRVANILEGSVRKSGNQVRVTAQLIKADDGFHLWSDTYDRQLDNIFAIQDEIARAIADNLKVTLNLQAGESGNLTGTTSLEAYEYYLQGMAKWHLRTPDNLFSAVEDFDRAIRIDPQFAKAYAGAALAWAVIPGYIAFNAEEAQVKTIDYANRALQLDPNLAEAITAMAWTVGSQMNIDAARAYYEHSIELNPSFATTYQWYGRMLSDAGDSAASLEMYQRAWDLDPRSRIIGNNYAWELMRTGMAGEAWQINEAVMEFAPDFPDGIELALIFSLIESDCPGVATYGHRLAKLLNKTEDSTDVYVQVCEATDPATRAVAIAKIISWPETSIADPQSPSLTYESEFGTALIELGEFEPALELLGRSVASGVAAKYDVNWYRSMGTPNGRRFSCDPRAIALFEQAELPPPPPQLECRK